MVKVEAIIYDKKRSYEIQRIMIIFTAKNFEYNDEARTKKDKIVIVQAARRQVSYNYYGFSADLAFSRVSKWDGDIFVCIDNGLAEQTNEQKKSLIYKLFMTFHLRNVG